MSLDFEFSSGWTTLRPSVVLRRPRRVIIEAPWRGDTVAESTRNELYTLDAMSDSLSRNEAPLSSAVLYALSGLLDDDNERDRALGIGMGFYWGEVADLCAVYEDHGISDGMAAGIIRAKKNGIPVEYRRIRN